MPDTTSANVWFYSYKCWISVACWVHRRYRVYFSRSAVRQSTRFAVNYGSNAVRGEQITEKISIPATADVFDGGIIGTMTIGDIVAPTGLALVFAPYDGILGLGVKTVEKTMNLDTFTDVASESTFGFCLG